jgi:hypothetical protein
VAWYNGDTLSIYRRGKMWWSRIEHGGTLFRRSLRTEDKQEAIKQDKALKTVILETGTCPRTFHPVGHAAYVRKWRQANPDKHKAIAQNRRARKHGNGGSFTAKEWATLKRQYGNHCVGCWKTEVELKALRRNLVPDHIVPIVKGGLNHITNLQPLCHGEGGCNNLKGAKYIDYVIS